MFTANQELEFNIAFLNQMVLKTKEDIEMWQKLQLETDSNKIRKWSDPEMRPSNVVTMVAWTKQLLALLENRIQQNELKQKELLTSEPIPAEWAILRFHQGQIMTKMNDIHFVKTRTACHDLKDKLLGPQHDFQIANRDIKTSQNVKKGKKRKVLLNKKFPLKLF